MVIFWLGGWEEKKKALLGLLYSRKEGKTKINRQKDEWAEEITIMYAGVSFNLP